MSCPRIWNTEKERPAKLNEKQSDRHLRREVKDKGDILLLLLLLLEEQHENSVAAVGK